jgi:xylose isomerase
MPESEQATARKTGVERYEAFVEALGRRIARGHNFLHEVAAAIERSQAAPTSQPADSEDTRQ